MNRLSFEPITLEPGTLHICTYMIDQPGLYHWSLYIVDDKGAVAQYHWSKNPASTPDNDIPAEQFTFEAVEKPIMKIDLKTMQMKFAMIKLDVYSPNPNTTHDVLAGHLRGIFQKSFKTIEENREVEITCRTWIVAALQKLREEGLIRLSEEEVAGLEEKVKEISRHAEQLTDSGLPTTGITSI